MHCYFLYHLVVRCSLVSSLASNDGTPLSSPQYVGIALFDIDQLSVVCCHLYQSVRIERSSETVKAPYNIWIIVFFHATYLDWTLAI